MTFEADNTLSQYRVWLKERQDQREANRLALAEISMHVERMERANEGFFLSPRSVEVLTILTDKLKPWREGL